MEDKNTEQDKAVSTSSGEGKKKTVKRKAPKWLKALEAQSWQAELLISGLVIAGLLQLPDIFIHWCEGYILESNEMGFMFLSFASMFLLAGIDSLILFFGFHFIFRSIWIALLGLNSVYPDGIDVGSTNGGGPKIWKKMKEKYPSLSNYNQELDDNCSLVFSVATVTIIFVTSISVLILLIYQLFQLLIAVFPVMSNYVIHIVIGIYVLFTLSSLVMQYLMKKYPDNKRIEKYSLAYGDAIGKAFSLYVFEQAIGYITSILFSNVKSKYFIVVPLIFGFFIGMAGGRHINSNPVYDNFGADEYFTFNNKPFKTFPFNYENLKQENVRIFTPIIPADIIYEDVLKVFIPTIEREKKHMDLVEWGLLKRIKNIGAARDSLHEINLQRYINFNQIFVNDVVCSNLDVQYYTHPNAQEEGILTYIPATKFKKGKNILEIRKNYFSEDGVQKIVKIPFYFERKN